MAKEQFQGNGAFSVNEAYATSLRYAVHTDDAGTPLSIDLRFMNGRAEIASAQLVAAEARDILGERNYRAVLDGQRAHDAATADGAKRVPERELRGRHLEFRQVLLPGYAPVAEENAILFDSRTRSNAGQARTTADEVGRSSEPTAPAGAAEAAAQRADAGPESASDTEDQARLRQLRARAVPDTVAKRFLKVDDRYYFPDKTLAFIDRGLKLRAQSNNLEVVRSIVAIAEARGWQALTVTGSKEFRREVWCEASLRGIDVLGHEPDELERQQLQRALERRQAASETEHPQEQQAQRAVSRAPAGADARLSRSGPITGVLLEAGAAHYKFDPQQGQSYYVKLRTDQGERVFWGVDLERALAESRTQAKPGDQVGIENQGSNAVTVKTALRDAGGQIVGEQKVDTHRNRWLIEKSSYFDERALKAAAFRNGERAKQELINEYPELANAIATMRLGERFAQAQIDLPDDRRRFEAWLRESLARAIEHGETINAPTVKQAAAVKLGAMRGEVDETVRRSAAQAATKGARAKASPVMEQARG